ncbi:hypothetical protein CONLIGDRAFT_699727, partial [Coniochaeta ligniaria NRRL 30616]
CINIGFQVLQCISCYPLPRCKPESIVQQSSTGAHAIMMLLNFELQDGGCRPPISWQSYKYTGIMDKRTNQSLFQVHRKKTPAQTSAGIMLRQRPLAQEGCRFPPMCQETHPCGPGNTTSVLQCWRQVIVMTLGHWLNDNGTLLIGVPSGGMSTLALLLSVSPSPVEASLLVTLARKL